MHQVQPQDTAHAAQDHDDHPPARPARKLPVVKIGPSVLRMSLGMRLALAGILIAVLWVAVALVVGGPS